MSVSITSIFFLILFATTPNDSSSLTFQRHIFSSTCSAFSYTTLERNRLLRHQCEHHQQHPDSKRLGGGWFILYPPKKSSSTLLSARKKKKDVGLVKNDNMDPEKRAALEGVLQSIERNYGRGSVVRLGDSDNGFKTDCIGSGSMTLDAALGGGYPKGRIIEIYGPESSAKTTLALHAIAESQRSGGTAAFVDAEHALDADYASNLGVDIDSLLVSQPDSGEMALDIVDKLVRSSAVDVIVVDSVAALVPRAELEGDMSDQQIGLQARLMSKAMRKIVGSLAMSQCTVIFLNQLRSKVGVIYGSPEVTSGGNALKFYSTIRLDTRRREILPENSGIRVKVKVVKNKVAPPFRTVELDVKFGEGIDSLGCLLDAANELGVVERRGSWYSYGGNNFAQGRVKAVECLRADEEFKQMLEKEVRIAMSSSQMKHDEEDFEEEEEEEEEVVFEEVVPSELSSSVRVGKGELE